MLKNFSESKQAFEESLPALESIEMSSKIPSGKDNNFVFRPGILFPEDRCDETLTRHASTLYCLLNLAYKKQHEFDMNDSVSYLSNIDNVAKEFRLLLEGLSDKVSTYNLHSSAFSLARHTELIGINYHQSRKNKGYYSWFTTPRPHASLVDEIEFLKQISLHPDCNDELRYASLKVFEKKLSATTLNTNDPLKKLLDAGIAHATCHIHPKICFKKLSDFCHSKDLVPPDELQLYINKIKKESASLSATEATFTH